MNTENKLSVIITGSTGMVGEGVLHVCLNDARVENILVINRKPCGIVHPKLKEIIRSDFFDLSSIENELKGYNACFFCLGITSLRATEEQYSKITYDLTLYIANVLCKLNPDMTFIYVSGAGTTGDENARLMWVRVKSKTENALAKLPFKKQFNFRPGFIKPIKGLKRVHPFYKYITWIFPIGRALYPNGFATLREIGNAMLNACYIEDDRKNFEGKDIIAYGKTKSEE
ncbi:epimerase [Arachidicoccus ginsenosidimutans]|uniref:NAD-dependent epimerase/dehydratase family protein n=1 Tax=Arachidicoccus sp. BS20 TaxID=1850526 RepID=UPI0007F16E21|nr:NAD-dependent epimerase/dehydratase family protein [Arachidicoccus sp. BS20]ANI88706.1 epimerase [Arachidicoccus sp. BS20]